MRTPEQGIETLTRHGFESNSPTTSREALRCLANALVLEPSTRQVFVDLDYAPKAAERLKVGGLELLSCLTRCQPAYVLPALLC